MVPDIGSILALVLTNDSHTLSLVPSFPIFLPFCLIELLLHFSQILMCVGLCIIVITEE